MVSRLTAAMIFVGATLCSIPVYAESSDAPPPQAASKDQGAPTRLELQLSDVESPDMDKLNLRYLKAAVIDTGRVVASPLHWKTNEWLKLGLVLGGTGSLFLVDKKIKDFSQSNQSSVASKFASVGNFVGNPGYLYPSIGTFYLYGYLADDSKARRASLLALESLTISGLLTSGIKMVAKRHRPDTEDSPFSFDGPNLSGKNVSFSSGHTASAFSVATIFAEEYKDNAYVPSIAYGLATLTGLSRIYSNEHWSSDALFGAALGYFVSKAVLSYHKEDKNKLGKRLTIMPEVGKQMTGMTVKYNF